MGSKVKLETRDGLTPFGLFMNTTKDTPWKKDARVREAIYRTVDRKQLLSCGKSVSRPCVRVPLALSIDFDHV